MKIYLIALVLFLPFLAVSQNAFNEAAEKEKIQQASNNFSKAFMGKDVEGMVSVYTEDAKIFPNGLDILSGEQLKNYWTPHTKSPETIYHKITSEHIQFFGDYAHDYGYYEGKTKLEDGSINEWKGKYVVLWKKEDGMWKMHIDIWNQIKDKN